MRTLVETWLQTPGGLLRTYPQVFDPDACAEQVVAVVDDRVVSHAATRSVTVSTPQGRVRALVVGTVATAPDQRGNGHATTLLEWITTEARATGHDIVLLWSDQWAFYQRLGFAPVGQQHEVVVKAQFSGIAVGLRPARAGDLPAILALHRNKPVAVERTYADLALQLSASPMLTVVLEQQGRIHAYACYGKGLDFTGWWHEYGGDDSDIVTLIQGTMATSGQEQGTILVPPYRTRLPSLFGRAVLATKAGAAALGLPLTERGRFELFLDGLDSI